MAFSKHPTNQYEKKIDSIDAYLLRIMKRYFDTEDLNNAIIREAIIAEAMSRYKSEIKLDVSDVLSLNDKVGRVSFSLFDIKGERAFQKRTAFNKDFGNSNDTICEGNDERLSDDRVPTEHSHDFQKMHELITIFEDYERMLTSIIRTFHSHKNKKILDKIIYDGEPRSEIDLILLEKIKSTINAILDSLRKEAINIENDIEKYIEELNVTLKIINDIMTIVKEGLKNKNITIKEIIEEYSQKEIRLLTEYIDTILKQITCEELNNIIEILQTVYCFIGEGEISLEELLPTLGDTVSSDNGESLEYMYNNSLRIQHRVVSEVPEYSYWEWNNADGSFECTVNSAQYLGFISDNSYDQYEHKVTLSSTSADNDIISVILAYTEDELGNQHTLSLLFASSYGPDSSIFLPSAASIVYDFELSTAKVITGGSMPLHSTYRRWDTIPNGISVKVIRKGDLFQIYHSEWNDTVLHTEPDIVFSLTDDELLDKFTGAMRYGYGCKSQENSKFLNVNFTGYTGTVLTEPVYTESNIDEAILSKLQRSLDIRSDIKVELSLKYFKSETEEIVTRLPYMCVTNDLNSVIICDITEEGKIKIKVYPISGESIPIEICKGFIQYKIYAPRVINKIIR